MALNRSKALEAARKHLSKGHLDRAVAEYERLAADDPRDARTLLKLGDLYTKQGDTAGAASTYRRVADHYGEQGFFLKAVAVYKQVIALKGEDLETWDKLGEMYEALALQTDAVDAYERVIDGYTRAGSAQRALGAMQKLVALEPDEVTHRIRHGEALLSVHRKAEAVDAFGGAATLFKRDGRWVDAIQLMERMSALAPDDVGVLGQLAEAQLESGDGKSALATLHQGFQRDPTDTGVLQLLARAFISLGQPQKAAEVYRELAQVVEANGDETGLAAALTALLEVAPDDSQASARLAGLQADQVDDFDEIAVDHDASDLAQDATAMAEKAATEEGGQKDPDDLASDIILVDDQDSALMPLIRHAAPSEEDPASQAELAAATGEGAMGDAPDEDVDLESDIRQVGYDQAGHDEVRFDQAGRDESGAPAPTDADDAVESLEDKVERMLGECEAFLRYRLDDKVEDQLKEVITLSPHHVGALVKLGGFYADRGRPQEAAERFRAAAAAPGVDPSSARQYLALADTLDPAVRDDEEPLIFLEPDLDEPKVEERDVLEPSSAAPSFAEPSSAEPSFAELEAPAEAITVAPPAPAAPIGGARLPLGDPRGVGALRSSVGPGGLEGGVDTSLEADTDIDVELEDDFEVLVEDVTEAEYQLITEVQQEIFRESRRPNPPSSGPSAAPEAPGNPGPHPALPRGLASAAPLDAQPGEPAELDRDAEAHGEPDAPAPAVGTATASTIAREASAPTSAAPEARRAPSKRPLDLPAPLPSDPPRVPDDAAGPTPESRGAQTETQPEPPKATEVPEMSSEALPEVPSESPPVAKEGPETAPQDLPEAVEEALQEAAFYLEQGMLEEAVEALQEGLVETPDHPALLARLDAVQAPPDESFAYAQQLAQETAGGSGRSGAPPTEHHPAARSPQDEAARALSQFKAGVARSIDAKDADTHRELAIAYMEMGLHREALEAFELSLDEAGPICHTRTMMGRCHLSLGAFEAAIAQFVEALACEPTANEETDLRFELGHAHEHLGRKEEALEHFRAVAMLDPQYRGVAERIAQLEGVQAGAAAETVNAGGDDTDFDAMFEDILLKD